MSRATGMVRIVAIGAVLGPTFFANTFQAGYTVPNLVYTVVAGPVLAMVVVPALVRAGVDHGLDHCRAVLARLVGLVVAAASALTLALLAATPAVVWSLTTSIPSGAGHERARTLTALLIVFVAPQVLLYSVAALGVAAQQARGRFALAAAAPALENVGVVATVAFAGVLYGEGLEVPAVPTEMLVLLGGGSTAAVAVHAAVQAWGARRAGLTLWPGLALRARARSVAPSDAVRAAARKPAGDAFRRLLHSAPVAACPAAGIYALLALASTVPGGVLVVQTSYAVLSALSYLGARAVSMAALPTLAAESGARFATAWRRTLTYAMVASTPALVLLVAYAVPSADLLAHGELRDPLLLGRLAACLVVVALAQLLAGVHDAGRQALFARGDHRGPRRAAVVALAAVLGLAASSLLAQPGTTRLVILVAALAAGELVGGVVVLALLRRVLRPERLTDRRGLVAVAAAAGAMLPIVGPGAWAAGLVDGPGWGRLLSLTVAAMSGLFAVCVFTVALRVVAHRGGGHS